MNDYMTKSELIDYFRDLSVYRSLMFSIGAYDDKKDYAGPDNNKTLSRFIPRTLWGIDCNLAFYHHDGLYFMGGDDADRFKADLAMIGTALFIIEKTPNRWYLYGTNWLRKHWARERLIKYWEGVRDEGKSSFTYRP